MPKTIGLVLRFLMGTAAAFSLLLCQQACTLYAQGAAPDAPNPPSSKPPPTKEIDALIVDLHDDSFYARNAAAKALGGKGAAGVPAIPALMDVLGDERNTAKAGYSLLINGSRAVDIAGNASDSLRKLIPLAKGFGFDYARSVLLAPLPDYSGHALMDLMGYLLHSGDRYILWSPATTMAERFTIDS